MGIVKIFALLSIFSLTLFSTSLVHKSFDKLVIESDGIIQGHVKEIKFKRSLDNFIYTFITLDNIKVLNGKYNVIVQVLDFFIQMRQQKWI